MNKAKKTLSIGLGSCLLIAGYVATCIIPNIFYRKNYSQAEIRRLTVVAHRGGAGLEPENTLRSVERGISEGADMVEIDIHQTADGHLVVCHDESVDRTTDGHGLIRDLTLDQIRSFHITDADGHATDLRIPTLAEVLDLVDGRVKMLVEIKRTADIYQGIEQQLVDEIHRRNAADWIVPQSFNDSVLETLHEIDPTLRLEKLWVCKLRGVPCGVDGTLSRFDFDKYSYVASFNFYYRSVTKALIDEIHRHGKEVKVWTVAGPADTPNLPVDGVITDYPDRW